MVAERLQSRRSIFDKKYVDTYFDYAGMSSRQFF